MTTKWMMGLFNVHAKMVRNILFEKGGCVCVDITEFRDERLLLSLEND